MTTDTLRNLLNPDALRQFAGAKSFDRGADYFANGSVGALVEGIETVSAKVQGASLYRVRLSLRSGNVAYECTCPVGDDGSFCKHCVAVALALLHPEQASGPTRKRKKNELPAVTMSDVRAHLGAQDKSVLVDLLVEHAAENDRLHQRLLLLAARQGSKGLDLSKYRQAIDAAVVTRKFIDYRAAREYARRIHDVIDFLDELMAQGYAVEVIKLTEHALSRVEKAVHSVDDSDGGLGEILFRLQRLHLAACKTAQPDPEALARRLCEWELRGEWDVFGGALETYASILGNRGIAVYRQLAEAAWAKVPALGPGKADRDGFTRRFQITRVMEALARQSGDVESLVAIKKRDLSLPYDYLEIAEIYSAANKHDLALDWAERGVEAFPERTDSRLREFLAHEYHRRNRHGDAMALAWAMFVESPTLEAYRRLKDHAIRSRAWKAWRARALAFLREPIAPAKANKQEDRWPTARRTDRSALVRIFLWEQDVNAAWQEAVDGDCSNELWMALAAQRQAEHPEDALPIYLRQIQPTVARGNNEAYHVAFALLGEIRGLMARLGRGAEFAEYIDSVRFTHKAKRNFIKLLDHAKWT